MTTANHGYSFTARSASARISAKAPAILEVPFLLAIQVDSTAVPAGDHAPINKREDSVCMPRSSRCSRSSYSGNAALEYVGYRLGEPAFDERECRTRGLSRRPCG